MLTIIKFHGNGYVIFCMKSFIKIIFNFKLNLL